MHVGFDLPPLSPPYTGIPNYTLFTLDALKRLSPNLQLSGFREFDWRAVDHEGLAVLAARGGKTLLGFDHLANVAAKAQSIGWSTSARRALRKAPVIHRAASRLRGFSYKVTSPHRGIDLFHAFIYRAPGRSDVPVLPVWYDLSHLRVPETHPVARLRWLETAAREAQDAPVIQTISAFTASELSCLLGIAPERIRVVYPGVSRVSDNLAAEPTLTRFGLRAFEYAITVSTLEPRKNLRTLVLAYTRLPVRVRLRFPLCIIGAQGWGDLNLPADTVALEREGSIRFLGFVTDETLRTLFANTRLMLYPSLYEGFGMPIAEALVEGAPVACSAAASMPEAAGDTAILIDPLDVDGWTHALSQSYDGRAHADLELRSKRQHHAERFSWDTAAVQVLRMYRELIR